MNRNYGKKSKRVHTEGNKKDNDDGPTDNDTSDDADAVSLREVAFKYSRLVAFLEDPKSHSPFHVLAMSQIRRISSAHAIDKMFLNSARRKRRHDMAIAHNYKYPFRVFAKVEPSYPTTDLHELVQVLNDKFQALKTCGVAVEMAYDNLLKTHSKKVRAGIDYETGAIKNRRLVAQKGKETTTSNTEGEDDQEHDEVRNCMSAPNFGWLIL